MRTDRNALLLPASARSGVVPTAALELHHVRTRLHVRRAALRSANSFGWLVAAEGHIGDQATPSGYPGPRRPCDTPSRPWTPAGSSDGPAAPCPRNRRPTAHRRPRPPARARTPRHSRSACKFFRRPHAFREYGASSWIYGCSCAIVIHRGCSWNQFCSDDKPTPPNAPRMTTTSGGVRQTVSNTNLTRASAKSPGDLTELIHSGL